MEYQVRGNQMAMTGRTATADAGGIGVGTTGAGQSLLKNNQVGDLLACKLVQGGAQPVLELNGIQMQTKAAEELVDANPGDTVYLKIQQADAAQVSLKIVGIQSAADTAQLGAVTSAQVMQSTEQFSDMIKENLGGALDEEQAKENQKEILRNLTADEIAKLRMMQIDVTNATLSDLMGMVITIRSGEYREEVNEQIGDIVRDTIGALRNSLIGSEPVRTDGTSTGESAALQTDDMGTGDASTELPGVNRLNSEGYVEKVPLRGKMPMQQTAEQTGTSQANAEEARISEEQMIYMIRNHMDFTIENVVNSRGRVNEESVARQQAVDPQVWTDIYPQVTAVIESAGMSVSEQSLGGARFMLEHELPITVDSLRMYMSVQALNRRGIQEDQLTANIAEQVSLGQTPQSARVSGSTIRERAAQLVEKVREITPSTVDAAVNRNKPLTVSYLYNATMKNRNTRMSREPVNTGAEGASLTLSGDGAEHQGYSGQPAAVTARRQLEEIRLSMTMEAATRLVRQDIHIDARPLSQLVDALRDQENRYYDDMVSTARDLHDIPEGVDLFKETLRQTDGLQDMPSYALGEMAVRPSITVGELYESADRTKAALAGEAYETMRTRPRADMGDSISDAFQNVDAILEDMQQDRNDTNRRAARILAYNQMELSEENLVRVKSADAKVQQMFETLTPQLVLQLIRENKNPISMTIDGLNEEIAQHGEVLGITDEQRFSEYLYQLDRTDGITDAERQSYIGIYRLLDKVEKSHGKDIGAVIRNGQEVTLQNLFAADKSRKAQGMDVRVDDSFGERVNVRTDENEILAQIETAYNQTLTGSILRHIKPQTLQSLKQTDYRDMPLEELCALVEAADTQDAGETALSEQLSEQIAQAMSCEDEVSMMLQANAMPETVTNILAAYRVMYGADGVYGMIHEMKQGLSKESARKVTQRENEVLSHMENRQDVLYDLENIRSALSGEIHAKEEDGTITAKDIQALKFLNAGMPIAMRAVEQDSFQVPLVVNDTVSIMRVSVLRDGEHAGEVTATMDTPKYGALAAMIRVEDDRVEGYVTVEDEQGQRMLESNELTFRSVFAKLGMEVRDLRLDGTRPAQYVRGNGAEPVATSLLYKAAKQLLTAVKLTGVASDN